MNSLPIQPLFINTMEPKTGTKDVVAELLKIAKKEFDYPMLVAKAHMLSDPEHSTFCPCNGNWSICCDNPANYPEYLCDECLLDSSASYTDYTPEECSCGCLGDWSECENNKENYKRDYTFSPAPSPHRDDDDWIKTEDNPLHKELMCDISIRGSTPRKMKVNFLEDCVRRYYLN